MHTIYCEAFPLLHLYLRRPTVFITGSFIHSLPGQRTSYFQFFPPSLPCILSLVSALESLITAVDLLVLVYIMSGFVRSLYPSSTIFQFKLSLSTYDLHYLREDE